MRNRVRSDRFKKYRIITMCILLLFLCAGCGQKQNRMDDTESESSKEETEGTAGDQNGQENGEENGEDGTTVEETGDLTGKKAGICMPDTLRERWTADAKQIRAQLEEQGCEVLEGFADSAQKQQEQIEDMIDQKVQLLIVAPVECDGLAEALNRAADERIFVISYDEVIMDTDALDYFVMFNHYQAGRMQGTYIAEHVPTAEGQKAKEQLTTVQVITEKGSKLSSKAMYQGLEDELAISLEDRVTLTQSDERREAAVTVEQSLFSEKSENGDEAALRLSLCRQNGQRPTGNAEHAIVYQNTEKEARTAAILAQMLLSGQPAKNVVKKLQEQDFECFYNNKSYDNGTGLIPGFLISSEFVKD